jgi:hypothetical protein
VRPDFDDYRVITTRGEIRRDAPHGCQARMESGFYELVERLGPEKIAQAMA